MAIFCFSRFAGGAAIHGGLGLALLGGRGGGVDLARRRCDGGAADEGDGGEGEGKRAAEAKVHGARKTRLKDPTEM